MPNLWKIESYKCKHTRQLSEDIYILKETVICIIVLPSQGYSESPTRVCKRVQIYNHYFFHVVLLLPDHVAQNIRTLWDKAHCIFQSKSKTNKTVDTRNGQGSVPWMSFLRRCTWFEFLFVFPSHTVLLEIFAVILVRWFAHSRLLETFAENYVSDFSISRTIFNEIKYFTVT